MNVRHTMAAMLASTIFALGAAGAARAADLVLPSEVAATHWKTDYMNEFAQAVGERTGGEIDVKVFPAGQIYNDQDALAALGTGAVHMVWPVSVRLETIAPATGILNLPFAITDEMMGNACFSQGLTKLISAQVEPRNLRVLGLLRTADLLFIFNGREVRNMDDLKGAKVRVTGGRVFLNLMDSLGISGVSMAASEMSTAMSQGAIDGVFSSPAGWAEMIGMSGDQAWYVPGLSLSTYAVVVDNGWFEALPADQQAAITETLDEIIAREWTEAKAADEKLLERMTEAGANINIADDAEMARWKDLVTKENESFRTTHGEVMAALDELEASCGLSE
ncbi:TRAP transporter substrate-binding protein DctP [Paracoccus alkenifer]|uniref:C4-dicarboxylate-binding protein DctP n=1 Tax=Paracoccus alkenifer TaxID=65735 RepID=A0A1H6K6A1_9RHOB|nr:TRAP transporter substrate-binding protein DctP [Paracoccus alkenifer]SEH67937.1 C4-dicarboxylate-binding protein DctP [Paracoccus alkenifer]